MGFFIRKRKSRNRKSSKWNRLEQGLMLMTLRWRQNAIQMMGRDKRNIIWGSETTTINSNDFHD